MKEQFQPHVRPNVSRLEQWRSEITEMRSLSWPHEKIARWLLNNKQLKISSEAVRKFCEVRGIKK